MWCGLSCSKPISLFASDEIVEAIFHQVDLFLKTHLCLHFSTILQKFVPKLDPTCSFPCLLLLIHKNSKDFDPHHSIHKTHRVQSFPFIKTLVILLLTHAHTVTNGEGIIIFFLGWNIGGGCGRARNAPVSNEFWLSEHRIRLLLDKRHTGPATRDDERKSPLPGARLLQRVAWSFDLFLVTKN